MKRKISLVFISILLAIAFVEGVLRLVIPEKDLYGDWLLIPFNEHYWDKDKSVIFIKTSVQDEILAEKKSNTVVLLGDSFVAGDPVKLEYSTPSRLSYYLQQHHISNEVVNLGVGGYGPDQEFKLFSQYINAGNRPKVVIWCFYVNDVFDNYNTPIFDISADGAFVSLDPSKNFIYRRQVFYDAIPLPRTIKYNSWIIHELLSSFDYWQFDQIPAGYQNNRDQWSIDKLTVELNLMEALSRALRFNLVYVLIAPQTAYMPRAAIPQDYDWTLKYYSVLSQVLTGRKNTILLDFQNSAPTSEKNVLGATAGLDDLLFTHPPQEAFGKGERHFNATGYDWFAQSLYDYIEHNSLLADPPKQPR